MPSATYGAPPTLGYGQRGEAPIDAVNAWMRTQPWYQTLIHSFGQTPDNVHLNDAQKQQVIRAAQANGVVVDEGGNGQEVDNSGNFKAKGHKLRNTLIVAGIAGAALATAGLAGAFGGAAASSAAGSGAAAAGTGASTAATIGTGSALAGGVLRYGLPVAGELASAVIGSRAASKASDAQQRYLEEALAYQKEQDAYARKTEADRYAASRGLEAARYGDYRSNISPYLASGSAANSRMAELLGLPLNTSAPSAPPMAPPQAPAPAPASAPQQAPAQPVSLQAPDGSIKQVDPAHVDHYLALGAKRVA